MNNVVYQITPTQVLKITCILRSLGLNTSHIGTKLINKSIQIVLKYDIEFITLDTIFNEIAKECNMNILTIRSNISNALLNRNKSLSKSNFEKIFGYDYYEKCFEPKVFIEEVSALIY